MPIHWRDKDNNIWTTHEGLVLERVTRINRVMSDIYANEYYAVVWNPDTKLTEKLKVGSSFELYDGPWGDVVADAAPDSVLKSYLKDKEDAKQLIEARAKTTRTAEELRMLEQDHHKPAKGKIMQVVRGHRVPLGTVGEVFWVGTGDQAGRVGLTTDGVRASEGRGPVWVDANYLVNIESCDPTPEEPPENPDEMPVPF